MLGHNRRAVPAALFEGFTRDPQPAEAIDEFTSALIIAYENAILNGMCPNSVIAAVLDWASLEIKKRNRARDD